MENIDTSFFAHSPGAKQWETVGVKNHQGFNIPLFSIHSENSYGIGEFPDLIPLIDWTKSVGFDVIQLLPINDSGRDTSPYSAISAFALNPIYIGLNALPNLDKYPQLQEELRLMPKMPRSHRIAYTHVRKAKDTFLRHYFQIAGHEITKSKAFQTFVSMSPWLTGYALYKILKDQFNWISWEDWPQEFKSPTESQLQKLAHDHSEEIEWHSFLQFLCDQQLGIASKHALSQQVFLKGDIPILINRDSCEVWLHRELFDLNYSAGAPPDMYSEVGQDWGFPTYNWETIEKQGYAWWIDRLNSASQYYPIYRLDHIVGFFRIWSIPQGKLSKDGFYIPSNQNIWIDHGQKIMLEMLNRCPMLPIGEDLGNVPPAVRSCLHALGICGTKVMRWERNWNGDKQFIRPDEYPLASMTTVSTHDSETLALWWQNNPAEAQDFALFKGWGYYPVLSRDHHREILWDSHHSRSLFHINLLQEYLALIPGLTWPNFEDERINVPGIVAETNWTYRFKPTVEEIVQNSALSHLMKELIA